MKDNKKVYIVIGVLAVILIIGVFVFSDFQFMNNDLDSNMSKDANLDIEFVSAELDTVNSIGYEAAAPDIIINDASFELNVSLKNPGDVVIYNIELVNKDNKVGTLINADSIFDITGRDNVLDNVEYSFIYADGTDIKNGDELLTSSDLILTVKYKENGSKIDNDTNITVKGTLLYKEK